MDELIEKLEKFRDVYNNEDPACCEPFLACNDMVSIVKHYRDTIHNPQLAESELRAQLLAETLEAINERDRWRNVKTEPPTEKWWYEIKVVHRGKISWHIAGWYPDENEFLTGVQPVEWRPLRDKPKPNA